MSASGASQSQPEPPATPQKSAPGAAQQNNLPQWLIDAGLGSWSIVGIVLVISGIVFATSQISPVFIAIFAALVFTALLNPIVDALAPHMKRGLAVLATLLGSLVTLAGLVTFVVTSVAGQWSSLGKQLVNGLDKIADFLDGTPFNIKTSSAEIVDWVSASVNKGQNYASENWEKIATRALTNVGGVGLFFMILFLTIFITIFFLLQGSQMWRWFLNMLPTDKRATWNHAAQAGWVTFSAYARGTMIIAFLNGVMAWIFLAIVGVPLASALGVLVMLGALIPLVGAPTAMLVAMLVALATSGPWTAIIVGIGIALIGQVEAHILQPLIMGAQVSLSPVVVGIGVIAGTLLAGLLGAIIAIPLIGVTWAVFSSLYKKDPPIEGALPNLREDSVNSADDSSPNNKRGMLADLKRLFHIKKTETSATTKKVNENP